MKGEIDSDHKFMAPMYWGEEKIHFGGEEISVESLVEELITLKKQNNTAGALLREIAYYFQSQVVDGNKKIVVPGKGVNVSEDFMIDYLKSWDFCNTSVKVRGRSIKLQMLIRLVIFLLVSRPLDHCDPRLALIDEAIKSSFRYICSSEMAEVETFVG
ncbi:hypothetical protein GF376_02890 [Candidatus Peregrinibacteria bacterium]|nr:hypothetical protein [Candidatus Peregrinibacteria bacterium]